MEVDAYPRTLFEANNKNRTGSQFLSTKATTWKPSGEGFVKINTDATLFNNFEYSGFGVVARDFRGKFLGCYSLPSDIILSPMMMEAVAFLEGMKFTRERGWEQVIFESNCHKITHEL